MQTKTIFWTLLLFTVSFSAKAQSEKLVFPESFQWCVATAGHQVEGDNIHSDWWQFEQKPGNIKNGDRSGKASFHMDRLEEDVKIMKDLNVETYRFSIEWSRIEPRPGEYDQAAIAYYHRELDLLKQNNILPMVTLHHFVQPQWFSERGGWSTPDSGDLFFKYVQKIEDEFGDKINMWITFNEPTVLLIGGYGEGFFAPGEKNWNLWKPLLNILKVHGRIYHFLHEKAAENNRTIQVGIAHHFRPLIADSWLMERFLPAADYLLNWNIPNALRTGELVGVDWKTFLGIRFPVYQKVKLPEIRDTQDFLGVNYYTREVIAFSFKSPFFERKMLEGVPASDLNWSIDPEGFFLTFKKLHGMFPQLPFYVTENGLADAKDQWRPQYIISHLKELHRAMTDLPHKILGYCHWSLFDNFEWQEGFEPRFGLIEVDYENQGERSLRPSAHLIKEIFGTNTLTVPE